LIALQNNDSGDDLTQQISFPAEDYAKKFIYAFVSLVVLLSGSTSGYSAEKSGINEKIGQNVLLDAVFLDEQGEKVSLRQLTGKPSIISLVYFSCQSRCPLLLGSLAEALGKSDFDTNDYRVITISFDDRDTPAMAAQIKPNYLKAIGRHFPDTSWRFLTGDSKTIDAFTRSVGFSFSKENSGFSHPRALIFLSPEGSISRYLYGMSFSPFDIAMALKEASVQKGFFSRSMLSLFCFSYDPQENRYVFNLGRTAAAAALFLMLSTLSFVCAARRKGGRI
jgi:protein SCO1